MKWSDLGWLVSLIGVVGGLITIIQFVTGRASIHAFLPWKTSSDIQRRSPVPNGCLGCLGLSLLISSLVCYGVWQGLNALFRTSANDRFQTAQSKKEGTWEDGLPSSPPDIKGSVPVIYLGEQAIPQGDSSCLFYENQRVAVVSADQNHTEVKSSSLGSYVLAGTDSMRDTYYVEDASEADASWLETIMIPGRRLNISYTVCGNGAIHSLKRIEVIPHEVSN